MSDCSELQKEIIDYRRSLITPHSFSVSTEPIGFSQIRPTGPRAIDVPLPNARQVPVTIAQHSDQGIKMGYPLPSPCFGGITRITKPSLFKCKISLRKYGLID